jgi:hypothetical protein
VGELSAAPECTADATSSPARVGAVLVTSVHGCLHNAYGNLRICTTTTDDGSVCGSRDNIVGEYTLGAVRAFTFEKAFCFAPQRRGDSLLPLVTCACWPLR